MTTAAPPREGTREWTLWVVAASCALHVAEEYLTGWPAWARQALGIVMPTARFLVANAVLVVAALILARVAAMVAGTVMMFGVVLAARWLSGTVRYGG